MFIRATSFQLGSSPVWPKEFLSLAVCVLWCATLSCAACSGGVESDLGAEISSVDDLTGEGNDSTGRPSALIELSERTDLFHPAMFSRITAWVKDGPDPEFYAVTLESGSCRYLSLTFGVCSPSCGQTEVCAATNRCEPYPAFVSGGLLTVSGLGMSLEIAPEDWSPGTYNGPAGLPGKLFEAQDEIAVELAGEVFPTVNLKAHGVAAMDPELATTGLALNDGEDAVITWSPGSDPVAFVQVVLYGANFSHGAPLQEMIICEGPDSGSMTIPRALVKKFPYGETPQVTEGYDWPHSELSRLTRSEQMTSLGIARLIVRSTTYFLVSHSQ
jgi:hypothetical protein